MYERFTVNNAYHHFCWRWVCHSNSMYKANEEERLFAAGWKSVYSHAAAAKWLWLTGNSSVSVHAMPAQAIEWEVRFAYSRFVSKFGIQKSEFMQLFRYFAINLLRGTEHGSNCEREFRCVCLRFVTQSARYLLLLWKHGLFVAGIHVDMDCRWAFVRDRLLSGDPAASIQSAPVRWKRAHSECGISRCVATATRFPVEMFVCFGFCLRHSWHAQCTCHLCRANVCPCTMHIIFFNWYLIGRASAGIHWQMDWTPYDWRKYLLFLEMSTHRNVHICRPWIFLLEPRVAR